MSILELLPKQAIVIPIPQAPVRSYHLQGQLSLTVAQALIKCAPSRGLELNERILEHDDRSNKRMGELSLEQRLNQKLAWREGQEIDRVKNCDCILSDDFTTSGQTLTQAAEFLLDRGAKRVFAVTLGLKPKLDVDGI